MGAQSSVLNVTTTFKEPDFPSLRGQGVYLSPQHPDLAIRQLSANFQLSPTGIHSLPVLKGKTEQLPDCVLGGKLLETKDVQTRDGVKKEVSGLILQGIYTLADLLNQGKLRLPNPDVYSTVLASLITAGKQLESKLEFPVLSTLESVYILSDGRILLSNPYLEHRYIEFQLEKIIPIVQANSTGFLNARAYFEREAEKNPSGPENQAWQFFNQKVRQSVQISFALALKLAIGNRDNLIYNTDGSLDQSALQNDIRIFESFYSAEHTQLLRKVLLNSVNSPGFPTFLSFDTQSQANKTIQLSASDYVWVKQLYSVSQGSVPTLHQSLTKPPIILLQPSQQQSFVSSGNNLPLNAQTPMLDKFKKHPIEYQFPVGGRRSINKADTAVPARVVQDFSSTGKLAETTGIPWRTGQEDWAGSTGNVKRTLPNRILDPYVDGPFQNDYKNWGSNWRQNTKPVRPVGAFFDPTLHPGNNTPGLLPPGFLEASSTLPPGFLSATQNTQGFYEPVQHRAASIPSVRQEALYLGAGDLNKGLANYATVRGLPSKIQSDAQFNPTGPVANANQQRHTQEGSLIAQRVSRINEKSRSPSANQVKYDPISNLEFLKNLQRRKRGSDLLSDADKFLGGEKNFLSMNKIRVVPPKIPLI